MTTQEELSNNESYDELNGFLDGAVEVDDFVENEFTDENTPGLNSPVDNVSMFDIVDFSLEGKKTYFERNNWNVVVGSKGKSIEMIPTDIIVMDLGGNDTRSGTGIQMYSDFNFSLEHGSQYLSAIENSTNKVIIKRDGIYKISFKFGVEFVNHIEGYILGMSMSDGQTLFYKEYGSNTGIDIDANGSCSGTCSTSEGSGSCSGSCSTHTTIYLDNLRLTRRFNSGYREGLFELKKGDELQFVMMAIYEPTYTGSIRLLEDYTSWDIQYLKSNR